MELPVWQILFQQGITKVYRYGVGKIQMTAPQ